MYCGHCGASNPDDARYCGECGNLISTQDDSLIETNHANYKLRILIVGIITIISIGLVMGIRLIESGGSRKILTLRLIKLTPVPTVFGGGSGKIIFQSSFEGIANIYIMDSNGSNVNRLTHTGPAWQPSLSPDGKHILYTCCQNGNWKIYSMDSDGFNVIQLSKTSGSDNFPVLSPDGKCIAFTYDQYGNGKWEIYIMDSDGSNRIQLTKNANIVDGPLSWSPDGKHIVFTEREGEKFPLYIMNSDGSNPIPLTSGVVDSYASWSPDGKHIAFTSTQGNNSQIYVMNSDGSHIIQLTNTGNFGNGYPSWSPDGKHIVFVSDRGEIESGKGKSDIYVMDSDGSNSIQLTNNGLYNYDPKWSY